MISFGLNRQGAKAVILYHHSRTFRQALLLSLASLPLVLAAQTPVADAPQDWRSANQIVGQYPRGYADVLKWEQANPPPATAQEQPPAGLPLLSLEDVVRQAWRAHPDLAQTMSRLGPVTVTQVATGRWSELNPDLQRKVEDINELLDVAAQARKAWLQAVASRQVLPPYRAALAATEAARELGRRMVSVGNWSRLQQTQVQLAQSSAVMSLHRAQYAASQAQANLINTLGLRGVYARVQLPDKLPQAPEQIMSAGELQQRALALQSQLPRAEQVRNQANADLAQAAYEASHALVQANRDVLKVRDLISEETVLYYNGMLKSVWDLLDEKRKQSQAEIDVIGAQRDFWMAESDLQWVLQGGTPDNFFSLGGGGETAAPAAH
jgi:hypothetical protein